MIKSMTGYGRGECLKNHRKFKVEMKSVNHRYSDFSIRMPRFLNPFEDKIRRRLAKDITRGKVDIWINFESYAAGDVTVKINEIFADAYSNALKHLTNRYQMEEIPSSIVLELMAKTPDIMVFDKYETALNTAEVKNEIWENFSEALEVAISNYNKMRETEGKALASDMLRNHLLIEDLIVLMRGHAPTIIHEHETKLRERIAEIMEKYNASPEDSRILTEIAIIADKSDINEELTRLDSHMKQFKIILSEKQAIGRKLDFLVQEMNREVNTIGSKSNDIELTKYVVELKSIIEKIREQIQNIE